MVGTWVFLALALRQLISSLIKTAEFMVKFSGEYKRCLNTYLIIFRLFQLCTIVFIKFGYLIFGLHSKLSTNGWWLENRSLLGGCLIWTNKISVEKWWAYCLGHWLPLEIEKVQRTGHAKDFSVLWKGFHDLCDFFLYLLLSRLSLISVLDWKSSYWCRFLLK